MQKERKAYRKSWFFCVHGWHESVQIYQISIAQKDSVSALTINTIDPITTKQAKPLKLLYFYQVYALYLIKIKENKMIHRVLELFNKNCPCVEYPGYNSILNKQLHHCCNIQL